MCRAQGVVLKKMAAAELLLPGEFEAMVQTISRAYRTLHPQTAGDDCSMAVVAPGPSAVQRPLVVGLAGVPGAGKTTLAHALAKTLTDVFCCHNRCREGESSSPGDAFCIAVPMDGYHKYRAELSAMPNAEEAFVKRGIHWTFSPEKLCGDLQKLHATSHWDAPAFDHAEKDPVEGAYHISPRNRIVIVEGIYMAYQATKEWHAVHAFVDVTIFVDIDLDISTERLTQRHMAAWNIPRSEAHARAAGSDLDNAREIVRDISVHPPHLIVHSVSTVSPLLATFPSD